MMIIQISPSAVVYQGTFILFDCLHYYVYIHIVFWNLKLKRMVLLIFKNSGNSKSSKSGCNDYFFQNEKYINNQVPLPKSMKIGRNKK